MLQSSLIREIMYTRKSKNRLLKVVWIESVMFRVESLLLVKATAFSRYSDITFGFQ